MKNNLSEHDIQIANDKSGRNLSKFLIITSIFGVSIFSVGCMDDTAKINAMVEPLRQQLEEANAALATAQSAEKQARSEMDQMKGRLAELEKASQPKDEAAEQKKLVEALTAALKPVIEETIKTQVKAELANAPVQQPVQQGQPIQQGQPLQPDGGVRTTSGQGQSNPNKFRFDFGN